ncbi:MAG: hypothetical protein QW091_00180 [Candidatus Micrarchaeaceae archaeon]
MFSPLLLLLKMIFTACGVSISMLLAFMSIKEAFSIGSFVFRSALILVAVFVCSFAVYMVFA